MRRIHPGSRRLWRGLVDHPPMKVVTWNVNGIRARKDQVLALLADEEPDVVCMQETRASPQQIPETLAVKRRP